MSFPRYPEYKDSGVEWLGEVPAHWEKLKLSLISLEKCDGPFGSAIKSEHYRDNGVRVIRLQNIKKYFFNGEDAAYIDSDYYCQRISKSDVVGDDLLIAGLGDDNNVVGRACVAPCSIAPAMVKADCFRFRLDTKRALPNFLAYQLSAGAEADAGLLSTGSTRSRIPLSTMGTRIVALPPRDEQVKVSAFLDHETTCIDALVEEQQRLIELLNEKRQAVISHAVTKGLDPDVPMKDSGVEWLGEVPAHWAVTKVAYHYEVVLGKMLDERRITGKHLAPYLRNTDVQWDRINVESLPVMDFSPADRKKYELKEGDLLVCEGGEVGRSAIWEGQKSECYYQKALHRMRPLQKSSESPRFMFYLLWHASEQERFTSMEGKSTIAHLPAETLRQYQFPFPPKSEQEMIVGYLDRASREMNKLVDKAAVAIRLLNERRSALISAAVTGKIDVRAWQADQQSEQPELLRAAEERATYG